MIGVPDGGMCGRHSYDTSPRSSTHSRDRHQAGTLRMSPWYIIRPDYLIVGDNPSCDVTEYRVDE